MKINKQNLIAEEATKLLDKQRVKKARSEWKREHPNHKLETVIKFC